MNGTSPENLGQDAIVIDPETSQPEVLGSGRIAIIGEAGVERVVHLTSAETNTVLDTLVATGQLTYGA